MSLLWSLLLLAAGIAASVGLKRLSRRRRRRLWVAVAEAEERRDWTGAEALIRKGLTERRPPEEIVWLQFRLAGVFMAQDRFAEALAALDQMEGQLLGPYRMASWLTTRAYVLAELQRAGAALADLDEAELLLLDQEDPRARFLRACVWGNRGIAHLVAGRLEQAEQWTRRAYEVVVALDEARPASNPDPRGFSEWFAEHWWWRAEIARRAGRHDEARGHLARGADYPDTKWGARARAALTSVN